jgi:hypothetical protein
MVEIDRATVERCARVLVPEWYGGFEDQRMKEEGSAEWLNPPGTPNDNARRIARAVLAASGLVEERDDARSIVTKLERELYASEQRVAEMEAALRKIGEICYDETAAQMARDVLASAPAPAPERDGWRPIDSAPRDGTSIILALGNVPISSELSLTTQMLVGCYRDDGLDWRFAAPVGYGGIPDEWIVGWQPLPAPPRETPT